MMEGWKRRRLSAGVENPIDVSLTCILGGDGSFLVLAQFRHQCASKCQGVNHTSFTRIHAQQSRWMDANIFNRPEVPSFARPGGQPHDSGFSTVDTFGGVNYDYCSRVVSTHSHIQLRDA